MISWKYFLCSSLLLLALGIVNSTKGQESKTVELNSDKKNESIPVCGLNQECRNNFCLCADGFRHLADHGILNCTKLNENSNCPDDCEANTECVDGKCVCKQGYARKYIDSHDCIECFDRSCIGDFAVYRNCFIDHTNNTESTSTTNGATTTESITTTNGATTTESITTTNGATTTESITTTNGATTTESITTTNGATTTESTATKKSITTTESITTTNGATTTESTTTTTTSKPTHKPTSKPAEAGLSKWAIAGIIILVSCVIGFVGFILYRYKYRSENRIAPTNRI